MSTRAIIANRTNESWEGVYHHFDGYPKGLGKMLWDQIHSKEFDSLQDFVDFIIYKHPGGWSSINKDHHMVSSGAHGGDKITDRKGRQCYCHGYFARRDNIKPSSCVLRTPKTADPLWHEWLYIIDTDREVMEIWTSYMVSQNSNKSQKKPPERTKEGWDYGHCVYKHIKVTEVDLNGKEPDWDQIENSNKGS